MPKEFGPTDMFSVLPDTFGIGVGRLQFRSRRIVTPDDTLSQAHQKITDDFREKFARERADHPERFRDTVGKKGGDDSGTGLSITGKDLDDSNDDRQIQGIHDNDDE